MKLLQHALDVVRRVSSDVNTGRKGFAACVQNYYGDFGMLFNSGKGASRASSIIGTSMTLRGGLSSVMRAAGASNFRLSRVVASAVITSVPTRLRTLRTQWREGSEEIAYKLIADFRGSPMVAKGSRAPSFSAIHFFSFAMISSSSFLSSAVGMYFGKVLVVFLSPERHAGLGVELLPANWPMARLKRMSGAYNSGSPALRKPLKRSTSPATSSR